MLLFVSAIASASVVAQQITPDPGAPVTLSFAGLHDTVSVRRDARGIPYIDAKNNDDLYFVQGYVTASDRLWQMDLLRRNARGELAEIFGPAVLEQDKLHQRYGFGRVADAMVSKASLEAKSTLEAYARGVNAYIESLDATTLPPEFAILQYKPRPWSPADSLAVLKNFAEALSSTWTLDLMRAALARAPEAARKDLMPERSSLDVLVVGADKVDRKTEALNKVSDNNALETADVSMLETASGVQQMMRESFERIGLNSEDRAASNNWVVSGKHTASGMPLLANDPHLDASAPSIWYMIHLSAPGVRVEGVTTAGAPGVIIGHNEYIAWGMTNLGPDVQDLYLEKFDDSKPGFYKTPAGLREATIIHDTIKVRNGTGIESVPYDVTITRHGPVILQKDGANYALRWTALDVNPIEYDPTYFLDRAKNWTEFQEALKRFPGPVQNFVYADVKGHIGYYGAGQIPIRKSGDGSIPYDGTTDEGEWTGYIPFEKLPHVFDPPGGIIVTANQRIAGDSYPYFLSHVWAAPYRAHRITERLTAKQHLSTDDIRSIQGDTYSYPADMLAKDFVREMKAGSVNASPETLKLLSEWNGNVDGDSRAALLAVLMRDSFRRQIVNWLLGTEVANEFRWGQINIFIDRVLAEKRPEWLPKSFKTYAELYAFCDQDARATISRKLGDDTSKWTWGRFESFRFPHPLAAAPMIGQQFAIAPQPQNGSIASVNVGNAVSMRFIADLSDWDKSLHSITLGESGRPTSPHWKDQLDQWLEVKPVVFPFSKEAVTRAAKLNMTLKPK